MKSQPKPTKADTSSASQPQKPRRKAAKAAPTHPHTHPEQFVGQFEMEDDLRQMDDETLFVLCLAMSKELERRNLARRKATPEFGEKP